MGPGNTKTELQERIAHRARWVVEIEPSTCTSNQDILVELAERLRAE